MLTCVRFENFYPYVEMTSVEKKTPANEG
ncbi:MAG: hypothetical protein ACI9GC_000634, partial [Phycisphaerales bacterium]